MAILLKPDTVYKATSTPVGSAVIQVVSGSITLMGSNVTKQDRKSKKIIIPKFSDLVSTGDTLSTGFYLMAALPEWIGFTGDAEVWARLVTEPIGANCIPAEDVED